MAPFQSVQGRLVMAPTPSEKVINVQTAMQPSRICRQFVQLMMFAGLSASAATNTATIQLFCTSVRVEKGQAELFGQVFFEMEFSSWFNWWNPNGEFYNLFREFPPTHESRLYLTDFATGFPVAEGAIDVTAPENLDGDEDGIPDFYQVKRGINVRLGGGSFTLFNPGTRDEAADSGSVTAHWVRSPGQHRGVCTLTLDGTTVITAPMDFVHPFEILEYRGTYVYVPTNSPTVAGDIEVTQTGNNARSLRGPMPVEKPPTDPLNALLILDSTWADAQGQSTPMLGGYLDLDSQYELEYFGALGLEDGDLSTSGETDYETYYIGIDDPNDYDGDRVPDLNDPPPLKTPVLKMTRSPLAPVPVLQITGGVGQSLDIQFTATLSPSAWTTVLPEPLMLTEDHHSLELPAPPGAGGFYRTLLLNP